MQNLRNVVWKLLSLYTGRLIVPISPPAPREFRHVITEKDTLVMTAAHRRHHMTPVCVMELRTSQPKALAVLIMFALSNSKVIWCGTNKPKNKNKTLRFLFVNASYILSVKDRMSVLWLVTGENPVLTSISDIVRGLNVWKAMSAQLLNWLLFTSFQD